MASTNRIDVDIHAQPPNFWLLIQKHTMLHLNRITNIRLGKVLNSGQ